MNKTKKGLIGVVVSGLLAFSGCGNIGSSMVRKALVSEDKPTDMSESDFAENYRNTADEIMELAKTRRDPETMEKVKQATRFYGRIKEFEKMKEAAKIYFEYDHREGDFLFKECQEILDAYTKKEK